MKRNTTLRLTALLLTAAMCTGLCTGFTVSAGKMNEGAGEQTEWTEIGQVEDELMGAEAGEPENPWAQEEEQETVENRETDKGDLLPEEEEIQEAQEAAGNQEEEQIEEQEQSEKRERKMSSRASAAGLSDPKIVQDSGMTAGQKVTWDCVWFGSYPQSEVESSDPVYSKLESADGWDSNNDVTVDGNRYRRIKKADATYATSEDDYDCYYDWFDSTIWHYFKYEPIKWRVLKINETQALLLSDITLDDQKYNTVLENNVTWENSTIRSWLNGYNASSNKQGKDYSEKNFIGSAFTSDEQAAIVNSFVVNANNIEYGTAGGNDTTDKIFLLSELEAYGDSASPRTYDVARRCKSSTYAKAMGVYSDTGDAYKGNCYWWLRSPGVNLFAAAHVNYDGSINDYGIEVNLSNYGVRAALNLNLSSNQWSPAGTVCSDVWVKEPQNNSSTTIKVSKIILSGTSKKIAAGKKIKLTAKVIPSNAKNKAVAWKSCNTKVATVNSKGIVTLKKNSGGKKVTITATAKDGSKKKATYNITSMKGVVKKVAISGKKTITLKAGKTLKLKAKVTASNAKKANKTLKWTSSNAKYATVSSTGKVTARKAGKGKKVTITAMATDGSGKKASVKVKLN